MQIVVLDAKTLAGTDLSPIAKLGTLKSYDTTSSDNIITRCKEAAVIITNKVQLTEQTIAALPQLRLICVAATGVNNIDLAAAKAHQIAVANVAGYSTPSVVQHTFTMLGNLMTNIHRYQQDCHAGLWQQSDMFCRLDYSINEIAGKNFVIVGHGTLGEAVAKVAQAFGAQVIIAERRGVTEIRTGRMAFEEALQIADIVSIHCPLTAETENLISSAEFALLPNHAYLINTARGGIVNEQALVDALTNKQIAGAAVDVLTQEPAQASNPLVQYQGENLLLTPHTAWASKEAIERLVGEIAINIESFVAGTTRNRVV